MLMYYISALLSCFMQTDWEKEENAANMSAGKRIKPFVFLFLSSFNLTFITPGISLSHLCLNTWGNE